MDSLLKALAVVVPFIGRCPTWFQVAVFAWLVLTAVLLIVGFVLGIQQPSSSTPGPESLQAATASSAAAFPPSVVPEVTAFAILQPLEGTVVEAGDTVRFVSPYDGRHHYVVVTPLQSPTRWIVDGPLEAFAGVPQDGNAQFGTTFAGRGERFSLQILATTIQLRRGALDQLPTDSRLSPAVRVIRAR